MTRPHLSWKRISGIAGLLLSTALAFIASADDSCVESKLLASDGDLDDVFGGSVAIYDGRIIIGAPADDDQGDWSGSSYIFRFDNGKWSEEAKLLASDGHANHYQGASVDLSANIAAVGAFAENSSSGSAYVFRFNGVEWVEETKLLSSDLALVDYFGLSIATNGDIVVVGAPLDDDSGDNSGSIYVFSFDGSTWIEEAKIVASDGSAGTWFGQGLAIKDDTIVVSTGRNERGDSTGAAYIYRYDGSTWVEEAKLTPSDGTSSDYFGASLSLSEDVAVVGAWGCEDNGMYSGAAYVFRNTADGWKEETKLLPSDGEVDAFFGSSVSIVGDLIAVGARKDDLLGSVYLFRFNGQNWIEEAKLFAADGAIDDLFGGEVAMDDEFIVVGASSASNEDGISTGAAYVYCKPVFCLGDANGDGLVDPLDSGFVLARFGCDVGSGDPSCDIADMNGDGLVDPLDVGYVLARFGMCE